MTQPKPVFVTSLTAFFLLVLLSCNKNFSEQKQNSNFTWSRTGPGGGGSTFIPTFSFHKPENFLVRCDMTGSYLTTDGGDSYQQINFRNGAQSFAYDPHNANTIYVGSATLNRSLDGGRTWQVLFPKTEEIDSAWYFGDHASFSIAPVSPSSYVDSVGSIDNIRVDPSDSSWLYFSMANYFFYSEDRGASFQRIKLDSSVDWIFATKEPAISDILLFTSSHIYTFNKYGKMLKREALPIAMSPAFSFTGGSTGDAKMIFYALHDRVQKDANEEFRETELWTSKDGGRNWTKSRDRMLNNEQALQPSYSMIAAAEYDARNAYIVCDRYLQPGADRQNRHWYGAMKTSDGDSWDWVWKGGGGSGQYAVKDGKDVTNLKDAWVADAFGGEYIRLLDAGVYPNDGDVAIVTDWYRTMKTTDGGKTWREVYSEPNADGTFTSRGMDVTTSYGIHFDPFDKDHIAVSYTDIGYHHSFNGGKSWTRSAQGVPAGWQNTCYWIVFDPEVKNKLWSAWSGLHDFPRGKMTRSPSWKDRAKGGICLSTDGGRTWTPTSNGLGDLAATTSIVLDPNSPKNNRTLYASVYNKGVFKSVDDGKTWTQKNKGISENTCAFELTIQQNGNLFLVVSPVPLHKDGKPGREILPGAVYKSTDGAETWQALEISDRPVIFPNGIGVDPEDDDRIFLACWAGIDRSDLVGGKVAVETGGNDKIETEGGIFMSEDGGSTWKSIFGRDKYVYDVTVDPIHRGRLYSNTFNGSAYLSDDWGVNWNKLEGYDFHWGHRVIVDENNPTRIYLTTFGSGVWRGESTSKPND